VNWKFWKSIESSMPDTGRKESAMSDTNNTATPPAGISKAELNVAIADAMKGFGEAIGKQVAELQKSNADALAATQKQFADVIAKIPQGVKAEDVAKVVTDQLAARDTAASAGKAKADFVAANLKGIPAIYADKLGGDATKWADEAKTIREGFQKDLAAAGIKAPAVTTSTAGGGTTAAAISPNKDLKGSQLIALGVKQTAASPVTAQLPALNEATLSAAAAAAGAGGAAQNAALASTAGGETK
jgi:hypothetical protein